MPGSSLSGSPSSLLSTVTARAPSGVLIPISTARKRVLGVIGDLARDELADRVEDDTAPLLGTPEEIIARLKQLEAGGATNILLVDPNASVRNLQAFAREVMPSFQTSRYAAAE